MIVLDWYFLQHSLQTYMYSIIHGTRYSGYRDIVKYMDIQTYFSKRGRHFVALEAISVVTEQILNLSQEKLSLKRVTRIS